MDIVRDLVRDLVGILFPGAVVVLLTWCSFWSAMVLFMPAIPLSMAPNTYAFLVPLIFSYIVGQFFRMKRMQAIEEECTETFRKTWPGKQAAVYRKKYGKDASKEFEPKGWTFNDSGWQKAAGELDALEGKYLAGKLSAELQEQRKDLYQKYADRFGLWELFPYPYRMKARQVLQCTEGYNRFFEKYDQQGITKYETFFLFCKSVIYECSASFKEEVLRQEALVRMFAGLYYATKYGKLLGGATAIAHLVFIVAHYAGAGWAANLQVAWSSVIAAGSCFALVIFIYTNQEILRSLRPMRTKELNLAHDAFYLICIKEIKEKENLEL